MNRTVHSTVKVVIDKCREYNFFYLLQDVTQVKGSAKERHKCRRSRHWRHELKITQERKDTG